MRRLVFALAGLFLFLLAVAFGFVALFLWLATQMEPWSAALIVGTLLLLAAFVVWLASRSAGDNSSRQTSDAQMLEALEQATSALKANDASLAELAGVLAIGFAIGRQISK